MDFARLIHTAYPVAASLSAHPSAYAKEIAYSKYISEVNGDNRVAYQKMLVSICRTIERYTVCWVHLLSDLNYPVPVLDTGPQENWRYQKIL